MFFYRYYTLKNFVFLYSLFFNNNLKNFAFLNKKTVKKKFKNLKFLPFFFKKKKFFYNSFLRSSKNYYKKNLFINSRLKYFIKKYKIRFKSHFLSLYLQFLKILQIKKKLRYLTKIRYSLNNFLLKDVTNQKNTIFQGNDLKDFNIKKKTILHFFFRHFFLFILKKKFKNVLKFSFIKLFKFKNFFFNTFFKKFDPVFFSLLFSKFLNRFMLNSRKFIVERIVLVVFLPLKFFISLKPLFLFYSVIQSSNSVLGFIYKNFSGRFQIVPTYLYFDKQIKNSIRSLASLIRKKQGAVSLFADQNRRYKRILKFSTILLRTQVIFYSKLGRFTQKKNYLFESLKRNHYLLVLNRTYLQYRWR